MRIPNSLIGLVFVTLIFLTAYLISWAVVETVELKKEA